MEQMVHRGRILIIDDSRAIQQYVSDLLKSVGYEVASAYDGAEGLELLHKNEPDVVLLDVEMPGMNGFEVLRRLEEEPHLFAVIMFTTCSSLPQIVEGLTAGAHDYVAKPFRDEELLARVAAADRSVVLKRELAEARRQADVALKRLQESQSQLIAEKKILAIARLAAGVAHEINNPLGFIRSNLSTLQRYAAFLLNVIDNSSLDGTAPGSGAAPPYDRKRLEIIRKDMAPLLLETQEGFSRIAEIITHFLRLEQGMGALEAHREDLNLIVTGIVASAGEGMAIGLETEPEPLPLMGSLQMLNTALLNILSNAIEAVSEGGEISVRTGRSGNTVFCSISDSGPVISPTDFPHVFDPFFTTKLEGHFGLGLTVAECFVNAHGGTIEISSSDSGTCVTVAFPADLGEPSPCEP